MTEEYKEKELKEWREELEVLMGKDSPDTPKMASIVDKLTHYTVDVDLLKKTHIGVTINKLRKKFKDDDVGKNAAHIQRLWKKLVEDSVEGNVSSRSSSEQSTDSVPPSALRKHHVTDEHDDDSCTVPQKSVRLDVEPPSDAVRRKCVDLLEEALHNGDESRISLAIKIESAVYDITQDGNGRKYQTKIRSKVANLKNCGNTELKQKVIEGSISVLKFAEMSCEEMAPPKLKELRKSIEEECMKEHELADDGGQTFTDQYACDQCHLRDASYRVIQERMVGDYEPVEVTVIACNKCNHHWKIY